ncbi:amidinotransferase [Xaviernesmea oryzae]|uniref:arginine deiminase n=1 Tax=Xaviernesmea oryzae TaxID=464029 RepID=A0A1Q9ASF5_9HYPH|nr:arginine deiminase family protein [Xaviernesmea oryzae]OLP58382.1 amidinotransferase [Xaviernesmea oryzae]SEL45069.1 N-Dimethylarginine dimethylaminohydrolase [Xaviernesmea oryzae]
MSDYGAQDMSLPLRRVLMRRPGDALLKADPARWHYGARFNAEQAIDEYESLVRLLLEKGVEILWLAEREDGLADSMFTADLSLVTAKGAVILRPGKPARAGEAALHEAACRAAGIPILGRLKSPGTVEGGDCLWIDAETLAVGRGLRTDEDGIAALSELLAPLGIDVLGYDLPLWRGAEACLHLGSIASFLARDLALIFPPILPVSFYRLLEEWGVSMIEAPSDEFRASGGMSVGILTLGPREVVMLDGYPKTRAALESAGCTVHAIRADVLCIGCEGGLGGLVCPLLREN